MSPETRVGYDYAHAIVDDRSRLANVELHDDEKAQTVTGFVERALAFFARHGIVAKRLMTDNVFTHVKNRRLRDQHAQSTQLNRRPAPDQPRSHRSLRQTRDGSERLCPRAQRPA